jgi:hypothetical protein
MVFSSANIFGGTLIKNLKFKIKNIKKKLQTNPKSK